MGRSLRRVAAGALVALVLSGFLVTVSESPAEARKVGNPGSGFQLKVQQGFMRIKTNEFDFNDENRLPQCSDGENNDGDQDTLIDTPDAQCDAGGAGQPESADDSEAEDGFQAKAPILLNNGTIAANGAVTFPMSGVSFPRQYQFVAANEASGGLVNDFVARIDILPTHDFTGTLNANTGEMSLRMRVRVAVSGGPLNSGCGVGSAGAPIDLNAAITGTTAPPGPNGPITGTPYNAATGRVTLVNNDFSVPGASGCSVTVVFNVNVDGNINDALGLPSAAGNNEARFTVEFTQPGADPTPGVTATFTANPTSGTAPLTVNVNAAGSTGGGSLSYAWDFDNNGTFEGSGLATSTTYNTGGTKTITLRVTDGDGDTAFTTRTVTVGANQPPVAPDRTLNTNEDTAGGITLTATDAEGTTPTFSLVAPSAANGNVVCTGPQSQTCTYTPNANFNGTDSFTYRATDGFGLTDNGTVTVNVAPVNDAPVASNVSATVTEDTGGPVTLSTASDVDLQPLTYTIVSPPTKGTLSPGTGAARTYTPNANQIGTDTFTYTASDGTATSNVATGTITINAVNDAPVADDQVGANAVSTNEDSPAPVTLTGSDVDGDGIIFGIVDPPDHGTLSGSLPNLTYTPVANYNGPDTFVFKVTDPSAASDNGTVEIEVGPVNDPPTTADLSVGTNQDTSVDVTIPSNDIDGDTLSFTPSSPTAGGGTVSCVDDLCTYTPASGFSGHDSFTVDVSDGNASAISAVEVNVSAVNNTPPVINDATIVGLEDSPRTFTLVSADADGDPRTHTVVLQPASGSLICTIGGVCTFTPAPDANGIQTATVQVSDGRGGIDSAVLTLQVVPINDAPSVPDQDLVTAEDTVGTIGLVPGTDIDGHTITWSVKVAPTKGSLTCSSAGACTYTPFADVNGNDSFEAEADDGHGSRVRTTIDVTITPQDDPPTAGVVHRALNEDSSTSFSLVGADDGGSVTFSASAATSGDLACSTAGACTFTADANVNGTETVAYTVSDGTSTAAGSIVLTINPANDDPVADSQALSTDEDTPISFTLQAADPDAGDTLAFQVTSTPGTGIVGGTAPDLTYIPGPNANGSVTIGFRVTDQSGRTSNGTVSIDVIAVDDQPVANSQTVTTPEDTAKAIALSGSDVEGPVTPAVVIPPLHGTYAAGVYTPALNYNGPDTIGFKVTSNTGQTAVGTVQITVTPVNDPPVANDQNVATSKTVPVAIPLAASDPDGAGTITYTILTGPTKGTLSGTAPNLTYDPTGFNTGSDTFTYKVTDAAGVVDSATVRITISGGPILATQLVVHPATVTKPGGVLGSLQQYTYNNLSATLTTVGSGDPIPNQTVRFTVNGVQICTAQTNAAGKATCSGRGARRDLPTYQAAYNGQVLVYAGTSGSGALS